MKLLISIAALLSTVILYAQKRITVTDPEIEFSYELPKKWKYVDNGYYIIVFSPSAIESEFLQITYTESGTADSEEHFTFIIDKLLPINEKDFKLM